MWTEPQNVPDNKYCSEDNWTSRQEIETHSNRKENTHCNEIKSIQSESGNEI